MYRDTPPPTVTPLSGEGAHRGVTYAGDVRKSIQIYIYREPKGIIMVVTVKIFQTEMMKYVLSLIRVIGKVLD